jgi:PKD-like domain/Secretion system C-terminal sorting domain
MKKSYFLAGVMAIGMSLGLSAQTSTFNFTGGLQTFTVPCGVTSVFVQTWGAQGGTGAVGGNSVSGGSGGLGGYAEGFLAVAPGDVLNIFVGGQGATPTGGFNGGANGGSTNAGGGGGASDIRVGGTAEANRVITAGGGGGGGRGGCHEGSGVGGVGGNGGFGGGGVGVNGNDSPQSSGVAGGGKGGNFGSVQGALGAAGIGCSGFLGAPGGTATTGTGAAGGAGQTCCCSSSNSVVGGGGGGGGQLGGGGGGGGSAGTTGCGGNSKGAGGGGGGGSSFVGGVTSGVVNNGIWLGNGQVSISWTNPVPPSHIITGTTTLCQGVSTNFTITPDIYSTFYTWTVPNGLIFNSGQNTATINVTAGLAGTYWVYVMGVNGPCSLNGPMDSIQVTVLPLPTVAATSGGDVCLGNVSSLSASGAVTYDWQPGSLTGAFITPTLSNTTTYVVTGTDANGCSATTTVTAVVNQLPMVTSNTSAITVCSGDMVTLFGAGAVSYSWSGGITDNVAFSATATTTYTVTGTDANGCSNTATSDVTVNPLPTVTANLSAITVCSGDTVTLFGQGATSYSWSGGITDNAPFLATATTTYIVTGTDANGCSNTATVLVTVNALPTVTLSSLGTHCVDDGTFTITQGSPAGGTYAGPGVTGTTYSPISGGIGTHTVLYSFTDQNGCSAQASNTVIINACVGVQEIEGFPTVTYMPNPATTTLQVRWDASKVAVNTIEVRDITGRLISTQQVTGNGAADINVETLPVGNYSLVLISATGKANYQFIKQ